MPTPPVFTDPILPALRFRGRHVQQTIFTYIQQQMVALGWVNDPVNFGGTAMTFIEAPPDETAASSSVKANTMAVTLGDEPEELEEQLGGGMYSVEYVVFIDIFGESYSGARSIAIDVKDVLTRKYLPVYDFSASQPIAVPGYWIEFEDVTGPRTPNGALNAEGFRKYWRVVTARALVTYSDVDYIDDAPGPVDMVGHTHGVGSAAGSLTVTAAVTPASPASVTATPNYETGDIVFTWDTVAGMDHWSLNYFVDDARINFDTVDASQLSFTWGPSNADYPSTPTAGHVYHLQVKGGIGSDFDSVGTASNDFTWTPPYDSVGTLVLVSNDETSVTLTAGQGGDGGMFAMRIRRAEGATPPATAADGIQVYDAEFFGGGANSPTFTDTGLAAATEYSYAGFACTQVSPFAADAATLNVTTTSPAQDMAVAIGGVSVVGANLDAETEVGP